MLTWKKLILFCISSLNMVVLEGAKGMNNRLRFLWILGV